MEKPKLLLFVDANIWLDFYRSRQSDAASNLLRHLEAVGDRIIVTHQLEMEYKKNRQAAIMDGMRALSAPGAIPTQGIFSDAAATKVIEKNLRTIKVRVDKLKKRVKRVLADPVHHDPVYQTCQRIFALESDLVLRIDDDRRVVVRRKALRRFYLGCPPRKQSDSSLGDAYNWEWMIQCAIKHKTGLVILTRDNDYGLDVDGTPYLNDHLKQEFSERVSKKRKVHLCRRITAALSLLGVKISKEERDEDAKDNEWLNINTSPKQAPELKIAPTTLGNLLANLVTVDTGTLTLEGANTLSLNVGSKSSNKG